APQQFADEVSASFQNLWKRMGITNDDYIRTTEPRHKAGVQKLFRTLQQNGFIELRSYTGQYCISDETFVDVPVGAPCPECGRITETVTEENYFFKLSEFQRPLIDLIESGTLAIQPDSRRNEVLSFLRGNVSPAYAQDAEIERDAIDPNSYLAETTGTTALGNLYLPRALKDLSISRTSFKWGIPVPGNEKHVIYVWLDALANYMTAIGYGSDDPTEQAKFQRYWPAELHLVGKEIIRFHCVYWPAFLLALNPDLAGKKPDELTFEAHVTWARKMLPKQITAHGWLLFENDKMSKSKGNIVRTETILDAFGTLCPPSPIPNAFPFRSVAEESAVPPTEPQPPTKAGQDLFAADVLRYFLLREIPFGQDGSFSFDALIARYNADLANGYGNLVSRVLKMIEQYYGGYIPQRGGQPWTPFSAPSQTFNWDNLHLYDVKTYSFDGTGFEEYEALDFNRRLEVIMGGIALCDSTLTRTAPWKLIKMPGEELTVSGLLYELVDSIRIITALLYPVMPYATAQVWSQLGLGDIEEAARKGELKNLQWGGLKPGTKLGPISPIFPRAPKELIQLMNDIEQNNSTQKTAKSAGLPQVNSDLDASKHTRSEFREMPIASASATAALNPVAETTHPLHAHHAEAAVPETPQIAIDDFVKIDLRVAEIVVAERIPKADKLLRLEVDLGYERRQILSGIAQWYTPEELIGRRIVVIANLAPRKMRGLESHGMLLAASHGEDGKPVLATFGEEIALGSRLK
ncbi:methionine--tRNA ligase subunit beta, partial [Edaphobacter sp.]|uniref:methionine--tRNA ligase subunit beta n=1 Tax=Edaphobacter sp. TaxID=1934404 RepID=UPI002DBEA1B7